ncbi:MAG: GlmL-related ornithine degradation protein [Clostridia bacterium]|nr:GlmL-related ornithine degradation protein [Clostridia bacterium]
MTVDILVAEIGSTTTLVNAFDGIGTDGVRFVCQGQAATSVLDGDVRIGLRAAIEDLSRRLGTQVSYREMFATSSAAGGLRMCVHGLVYDMTVRAAHAAALGAGAIVRMATAGKLTPGDIDELHAQRPNLIMIAGGTDYGERDTAVFNARAIAASGLKTPVIFAGNVQCRREVEAALEQAGIPCYTTENVYPKLDKLNIEPARRLIHAAFEEHIVKAPGMERIRDMVSGSIMPTPGAVMEAARLLYEDMGDLLVVDIGGATTDVHSVTEGSPEIAAMLISPEPMAKRTVEGDLGLYVNAANLVRLIGEDRLRAELGIDVGRTMERYKPVPDTPEQFALTQRLCLEAGITAVRRHAGELRYIYSPQGRQTIAEGKDLSITASIIGTGGALTRLPDRAALLRGIADCNKHGAMLYPKPGELTTLHDDDYIMASAGVLARRFPADALKLMKRSLKPA